MERRRAYDYHDRALPHLRALYQRMTQTEASIIAPGTAAPPIAIGIAVEEDPSDAIVTLRVTKFNDETRAAIDELKASGHVPEDAEVREVGELYAFSARDFVSPLCAAVACANEGGPRGTLGCFVVGGGAL